MTLLFVLTLAACSCDGCTEDEGAGRSGSATDSTATSVPAPRGGDAVSRATAVPPLARRASSSSSSGATPESLDGVRYCRRYEHGAPGKLSPSETQQRVGPLSRDVIAAIQNRDYPTLADLVHPVRGLMVQESLQAVDRATVAAIATDPSQRVLMGGLLLEQDPISLLEFLEAWVPLRTNHIDPPKMRVRDWLADRPVGYSDGCLPIHAGVPVFDWALPYVYFGVTPYEVEHGLRTLLGMSFDEYGHEGERSWYLIAIAVWDEYPPREAWDDYLASQ